MPVTEGAPPAIAGSSKAASPMETTRQGEKDLKAAWGVVKRFHALRLQIMNYMGSMKKIEQVAVRTLMAEFARLQTILSEDLTKSLSALRIELEASSEVLSADLLNVLNLHPGDPAFFRVRELIQKHHQSVSMKVNLPLIELEVAKEDLNRFLQERLRELGSNLRAREVLQEITQALASYNCKVRETILVPGMERLGIFNRIMLTLSMDQPMAALLPGILDGLSRRLGMMPPGVVDQPTSAREGFSRQWAATLREAVLMTEGREPDLDWVTPHVVHPALHQDYELDFQRWRVDDPHILHSNYELVITEVLDYYNIPFSSFDYMDGILGVFVSFFIRPSLQEPMYIYNVRTIPVPYHINADTVDETENENAYTHIIPDTEMVAMNRDTYINVDQSELKQCIRFSVMYFCEQTFLMKHTSEHTCETAIYHEQNPDIIKDKCNIQYYPELNPTPQILDAGKHILLGNIPEPWSVVCSKNDPIPNPLEASNYVIIKKKDLCQCSLSAGT